MTYAETQEVTEEVSELHEWRSTCALHSSRTSCGSNKIVSEETFMFKNLAK